MAFISRFLFLAIVLLSSCGSLMNPRERCTSRIFNEAIHELSAEGFVPIGTGVSSGFSPEFWVNRLKILLIVKGPIDIEGGREMVIHAARILRDKINAAPCADILFESLPVGAESVYVSISTDLTSSDAYAPYFQSVAFRGDKIVFLGQQNEDSMGADYEYEETLEEALEKLGESSF